MKCSQICIRRLVVKLKQCLNNSNRIHKSLKIAGLLQNDIDFCYGSSSSSFFFFFFWIIFDNVVQSRRACRWRIACWRFSRRHQFFGQGMMVKVNTIIYTDRCWMTVSCWHAQQTAVKSDERIDAFPETKQRNSHNQINGKKSSNIEDLGKKTSFAQSTSASLAELVDGKKKKNVCFMHNEYQNFWTK